MLGQVSWVAAWDRAPRAASNPPEHEQDALRRGQDGEPVRGDAQAAQVHHNDGHLGAGAGAVGLPAGPVARRGHAHRRHVHAAPGLMAAAGGQRRKGSSRRRAPQEFFYLSILKPCLTWIAYSRASVRFHTVAHPQPYAAMVETCARGRQQRTSITGMCALLHKAAQPGAAKKPPLLTSITTKGAMPTCAQRWQQRRAVSAAVAVRHRPSLVAGPGPSRA